jgi:hypothetical protein
MVRNNEQRGKETMKAISDLKEIIEKQQTIRTTRLNKYVTEIGKAYAGAGEKITRQQKAINDLNTKLIKVTGELKALRNRGKENEL